MLKVDSGRLLKTLFAFEEPESHTPEGVRYIESLMEGYRTEPLYLEDIDLDMFEEEDVYDVFSRTEELEKQQYKYEKIWEAMLKRPPVAAAKVGAFI